MEALALLLWITEIERRAWYNVIDMDVGPIHSLDELRFNPLSAFLNTAPKQCFGSRRFALSLERFAQPVAQIMQHHVSWIILPALAFVFCILYLALFVCLAWFALYSLLFATITRALLRVVSRAVLFLPFSGDFFLAWFTPRVKTIFFSVFCWVLLYVKIVGG